MELLRRSVKYKAVDVHWHDPATSFVEAVMSRAGREARCDWVEAAWRRGARFDAWSELLPTKRPGAHAAQEVGIDLAAIAPDTSFDPIQRHAVGATCPPACPRASSRWSAAAPPKAPHDARLHLRRLHRLRRLPGARCRQRAGRAAHSGRGTRGRFSCPLGRRRTARTVVPCPPSAKERIARCLIPACSGCA